MEAAVPPLDKDREPSRANGTTAQTNGTTAGNTQQGFRLEGRHSLGKIGVMEVYVIGLPLFFPKWIPS